MPENGQLTCSTCSASPGLASEMEQCVLVDLCGLHLPPKCHFSPAPSITWLQICPTELELEIFSDVVLKWHKGNIFQFHISACFWLWSLKTCPWASSPLPGRAVQRPSRWRTEKGRSLPPPPQRSISDSKFLEQRKDALSKTVANWTIERVDLHI